MVRARRTIGQSFSSRSNSLNFLRLILALSVVLSHVIELGGFRIPNGLNRTAFGQIAVYGFFGISGYLIAGSALRNHFWRYLWQRFLRIFPAFWACLVITAFVIGLLGWLSHPAVAHCGIRCYFTAHPNSPYGYVLADSLLKMNQNAIAGTPIGGVAPLVWNGPMWTLEYEFLCYLLLGGLGIIGLLRHRVPTLLTAGAVWGSILVISVTPGLANQFNVFQNLFWMNLLKFSAIFLVGSALYVWRDVVPDSGWVALGCGCLFVASLYLPTGGRDPQFFFTVSGVLAPLVAYPLIWLGIHLPFQRIGARNDYSYGVYIYGFPITQLLIIWGLARWGFAPFAVLVVAGTAAFAVGSWWVVERHALALKKMRFRGLSNLRLRGDADRRPSTPQTVAQTGLFDGSSASSRASPTEG